VAEEVGSTPSRIALAWTLTNPAVVSPVMGACPVAQAEDNLGALDVVLSLDQLDRLNRVSDPDPIFPARFVERPLVRQLIFGEA
jgi:aryl-alcohol dehydrogenase-like predicted oxidoreductase